MSRNCLLLFLLAIVLGGCYNKEYSEGRHYSFNYNFVVSADSIDLLRQQPEELASDLLTDSFTVLRGSHLVVADIRMLPIDTIDSVWVQVATETSDFGWSRETELLPRVMPDDPISQFIRTFSDSHVLWSVIVVSLIAVAYLLRLSRRQKTHIVHFNDIDSFYPTLLTLIVASAATFYASLQMFAPALWQQFYFHPTLNPFSVPGLLSVFLVSVWAMLIVGIAVVDDVRTQLPLDEALLYLAGLAGVCAVDYLLFSLTTLWYVGYGLLVLYGALALWQYFRNHGSSLACGQCGRKIRSKGRCPYCGALNE